MNFWLAPLHGITEYHFRNCLYKHTTGIRYAITPFFPVQSTAKLNIKRWKDLYPNNNQQVETIPQLMGTIPEHFVDTLSLLHDTYHYTRFNWNIGCPVAQIIRKQRGCGIMPHTSMVESVVKAACRLPYRFSVKMRLGLHHVEEGMEIIKMFNDYPLDFIVIHPRLGDQHYTGTPDLDTFEKMISLSHHPIVYSGDINDIETFLQLSTRFSSINNWMLGRGILKNPFLAEELINGKSIDEHIKLHRFITYYNDLVATLLSVRNEKGTLSNLKELWHYYSSFLPISPEQLTQLLRINDFREFRQQTAAYFSEIQS